MSNALDRARGMVAQYPENELARFSLGKLLYDAGEFAAARTEFQQALAKKSDWMIVQILIGKCDLALGDRVAARRAFERGRQLALDQNHEGPLAEMDELLAEWE